MGNSVSFIALGGYAGSPVRVRSMLLALVCAASTYIGAGIPFAAAQSAAVWELVDERGGISDVRADTGAAPRNLSGTSQREEQACRPACSLHLWGPTYRR